jgi:hypothetical protein
VHGEPAAHLARCGSGGQLDEGLQERCGELGDQSGERGADHDADREVDDVTAHDEVFEALEHAGGSPLR